MKTQDQLRIHILTSSVDRERGGMEHSVLRIAAHLQSIGDTIVSVYTRDERGRPNIPQNGLSLVDLALHRSHLSEPLARVPRELIDPGERYRLDYLLFRNAVMKKAMQDLGARHVIMSFFISTSGFIAQHVADSLQVPHIASVRGTDFSRDFHSPFRLHAVEHVTRNAAWIVTTNLKQEAALRHLFKRTERMSTVHNAIRIPKRQWKPQRRQVIEAIADCGYSFKKASHLLIKAVAQVRSQGCPIRLTLFGGTEAKEKEYWEDLRSTFMAKDPNGFRFRAYVAHEELLDHIADADLYCSATLGEGCANSALLPLVLGMPIVATNCGALEELSAGCNHVALCPPGDLEALIERLSSMVLNILENRVEVPKAMVGALRAKLAPERECREWKAVISSVALGT